MSFEVLFDVPVKKNEPSGPHSHRKPFGKGSRSCVSCYTFRGIIRKLMMCRRCFREYAGDIGFAIYD
ncbi:40S ribosomal protein S29 [Encephalitozoon cuniculi EcunIII-L]|uniref:40S ribosomal protein S29 n=1 Tax=Encephalitozoon cuniculi (strain GB-M1) TaxID=284813 RepID=UPI0006721325|nr:40S ribosomal protein S29 [Encephalitozoon cuniculi EcunIII-L]UYI27386.1 ribosomal protein S29 [Encephalitozoon cuniculi]7QEP_D9 Chain D9, 40S ribosomal protein S29 [Encephalitozoon cuniculi GB-M1]